MPVYEYLCVTCGNTFEHFVRSLASSEPVICPKCAGVQVSKQFSTFATKGSAAAAGGSAGGDAACSPGGG